MFLAIGKLLERIVNEAKLLCKYKNIIRIKEDMLLVEKGNLWALCLLGNSDCFCGTKKYKSFCQTWLKDFMFFKEQEQITVGRKWHDQRYQICNKLLNIQNYYQLIFINGEVNMWFLNLPGIKRIYFSILTNNLPLALEERSHLTTNPTSVVKCNAFQLLFLPKLPHWQEHNTCQLS